jgi:TPR repeat protein
MKEFISAVAVVLALSSTAHAQDFDKGVAAFGTGDYATALQELRPFAEQENPFAEQKNAAAQGLLGVMYRIGLGVPQDYTEAVSWFRKAAEQGDADAQNSLGVVYDNGHGVPQDNILAHMWFNISSANGNEKGSENRDIIAEEMTPQAIEQAQAMARDCMSSNYQNCGD